MTETPSTRCPFHAGQRVDVHTADPEKTEAGHVLSVHHDTGGWEITVSVFDTAHAPAHTVNVSSTRSGHRVTPAGLTRGAM